MHRIRNRLQNFKVFYSPNTLSTEANFCVLTQSSSENCPGESVNLNGIFRVTDVAFSKSAILKPLSAFTESPSSNKSSSLHGDVNSLSDMLPSNKSEPKDIAPHGEIAINAL